VIEKIRFLNDFGLALYALQLTGTSGSHGFQHPLVVVYATF